MKYTITIKTRDSQLIEFDCENEQTVQEAAETAGYFLPAMCKEGGCGTCLGTCQSGQFQLNDYSKAALPDDALNRGEILLCRTYPESPLQISVPYDAKQIQTQLTPPRDAKILSIETIADRTVSLKLQLLEDPEQGLGFEFEPGQYVELEVPDQNLKRAYSIANTPNWEGKLEFLIRLQPHGQFSNYLQQAKTEDCLRVYGPSGVFVLQTQSINPRCFIAGGTGLAPFFSILRRMQEWEEDHPTHLIFGVNHEAEIMCQKQLKELQQSLSQLSVEICVWKPTDNWHGFIGTPADALKTYLKRNNTNPDIYLCGPPVLVEAATKIALDAGISDNQIYSERFVSS